MHTLAVWLAATRPRTLPAAAVPVVMGTALAIHAGRFHGPAALAALLGALLLQIGCNFANDYYDFRNGADTDARVGPTRATAAGLVPPETMRRAFWLVFALSAAVGLYLVNRGGWPILAIGIASIAFAILYTGGPKPLGYLGLGELMVLVFFGPVAVAGTYYVQAGALSQGALVAGLCPGFLSSAILVVNNLRDIATDRATGKRTLAARFGPTFARVEYVAFLLAAFGVLGAQVSWGQLPPATLLAEFALVPGFFLMRAIWREEGRQLNPRLGQTGAVMIAFALLFGLGIWLASAAGGRLGG